MDWKFEVGQRVRKTGGYPFPGVVEARFMATQIDGSKVDRYVVNQTVVMHAGIGPSGLLHIFAPAQLVAIDGEEFIGIADMDADRDVRIDPEVAVAEAKAAMLVHQGLKPEDAP
jgi:hypothetical protein